MNTRRKAKNLEKGLANFSVTLFNLRTDIHNVCSFEERLAAQRKEREMKAAELGFKKPLSKEERIEKKKQRLAAIGNLCIYFAAS